MDFVGGFNSVCMCDKLVGGGGEAGTCAYRSRYIARYSLMLII